MHHEIERRAYELWEADGCPEGAADTYWFRAVAELTAAVAPTAKPRAVRKSAPKAKKAA